MILIYEVFARLTGEIKKETGIKGKELYHHCG